MNCLSCYFFTLLIRSSGSGSSAPEKAGEDESIFVYCKKAGKSSTALCDVALAVWNCREMTTSRWPDGRGEETMATVVFLMRKVRLSKLRAQSLGRVRVRC